MKIIEELNCEFDQIIFLDDNRINVQSAKDVGMRSVFVSGFEELKVQIARLGI